MSDASAARSRPLLTCAPSQLLSYTLVPGDIRFVAVEEEETETLRDDRETDGRMNVGWHLSGGHRGDAMSLGGLFFDKVVIFWLSRIEIRGEHPGYL